MALVELFSFCVIILNPEQDKHVEDGWMVLYSGLNNVQLWFTTIKLTFTHSK